MFSVCLSLYMAAVMLRRAWSTGPRGWARPRDQHYQGRMTSLAMSVVRRRLSEHHHFMVVRLRERGLQDAITLEYQMQEERGVAATSSAMHLLRHESSRHVLPTQRVPTCNDELHEKGRRLRGPIVDGPPPSKACPWRCRRSVAPARTRRTARTARAK